MWMPLNTPGGPGARSKRCRMGKRKGQAEGSFPKHSPDHGGSPTPNPPDRPHFVLCQRPQNPLLVSTPPPTTRPPNTPLCSVSTLLSSHYFPLPGDTFLSF